MAYPQQSMGQQSPFMQAYGSQAMQPQMGQQQGGQDQGWLKYLWEALFGTPGGIGEIGGNQQLLQQAMQQYMNPHQGFEPIRQDIGNYFKSDILPHIQNQFNAQTGGHFSSGILGSNVARGQMGLADRLAAAQAQYGQQQQQNALGGINAAKPQYFQQQGQKGVWHYGMEIAKLLASTIPGSSAGNIQGQQGPGGGPVDNNTFRQLGNQISGMQPFKFPGQ